MNILAIESSCDETAVAIVRDGREVLTDCIASQVDLHRIYGGVVPEIASRKHIEAIYGLADQALEKAGLPRKEFFIYSDDFEHALRVGKQGKMLCIPSAVLCHADNNPYSKEASWRDYYATRNVLIMYREHFGSFAAFRRGCMRRFTALRSINSLKMKVISTAIKDAKKGVTGLHPIYRPGWNPTKK